ncbi:hypothetical protein [Streptomyces sp. NPDC051636]|uniref:hypothetical protein n=1 Tax=Streptomyces sp. NPDC051636 TaxID=3365663 RepID=UPI003797ACE1
MNAVLPIIVSLTALYGFACGHFGIEPGGPLWLSWPLPIWNRIAHDWRHPRPRPNYARIARLEQELGIGRPEEETTT